MSARGLVVALVGPDGAGKTTVAEALVERLGGSVFPRAHYFRRRLGILPHHRAVKARLRSGAADAAAATAADIARQPPLAPWRALLQPAYQALELRLGARRIARLAEAGGLVVFDRYVYDAYLQSRNRAAPRRALDLVVRIAPRPDLVLLLDGDPAAIHRRKPELPVEEIRRQLAAARTALAGLPHARVVNTDGGAEQTIASAMAAVLERAGRPGAMAEAR